MYLTLYKSNIPDLKKFEYNNIMQNIPTYTESIVFFKTTYNITNPTELSTKHKEKINALQLYLTKAYNLLKPFELNYEQQYYTFKIPKRSGGLRTINAPLPEFKKALSKVKDIFEQELKCLAHDSAYAYVKQRSVQDALIKHQKNESNWYLKVDLTDFFANCTPDLIYNQLTQLYPFYYFNTNAKNELKNLIKICCLNNGLPQGTPMSPLLTNLLMVPYDYHIHKNLTRGIGKHFVYTRYADDIIISSKSEFDWKYIQQIIQDCIRPFQINEQKTRYGSRAGSNWNLGLMLNKDNDITLGHQKKKLINAMLNNFLNDFKNNIKWNKEDTYNLQGQLSYLQHIEPEYYAYIIQKYESKYDLTYKEILKIIL